MDLGAYVQIEDLDGLARLNGIEIPRLRGYRLMSQCKPYTEDEITDQIREAKICGREHGDSLTSLYYVKKDVRDQCEMWNKFAGRSDVLYIHSRIGGHCYDYEDKPWFLGCVVDWYDWTYCDIYAKIEKFPQEAENVN